MMSSRLAYFQERMLPVDEIEAENLAEEIRSNLPSLGYLTISNALQWRLQYIRVIEKTGRIDGIIKVK
ncbi:MAG: hypothetical protein LBQ54_12085 [Planctomycetaceae bacterium]|nr:hypothetical protein [Planctomycetaceae bacterium]